MTEVRSTVVQEALRDLYAAVGRLRERYPYRSFALDGRLVGDIVEVVAAERYQLTLLPPGTAVHDATTPDGRNVQIKGTFQNWLTFPSDPQKCPDMFLGLRVNRDGTVDEIFNGPGHMVGTMLAGRKKSHALHTVALSQFRGIAMMPQPNDQVQRRS